MEPGWRFQEERPVEKLGVAQVAAVAGEACGEELAASLFGSASVARKGRAGGFNAAATPSPVKVRVGQAVASNDEGCAASS